MKSDSYIEKSFLFLLITSILLHIVVFIVAVYLSKLEPKPPKEPVFIDLQQMPELKPQPPVKRESRRLAEKQVRVKRETAPRGLDMTDRGARPSTATPSKPYRPADEPIKPGSPISGLLKSRSQAARERNRPQLSPSSGRLAQMEETYRRKFEKEIAEGSTRFLNADDEMFGSFLTRFKSAVYLYWRYPDEAIRRGLEGTTPVKITFNRKGEIVRVQLLQSSGFKVLDDEVIRTLKEIGPMGGFPRGYNKEEFNLIGFFHYGGARGILR